ncbi:MAG: carboxypeptidase-like regulatory domain-containing protein, partial [Bacteroidetes bacterium]|nr:carboxypeptidase-like regulatory domain-containing protein [Bacteroidota bacterium]
LQISCTTPNEPPTPTIGSIYGSVIDAQTQLPAINVVIVAFNNQIADTTDSLGFFNLEGLSTGEETLQFTAAGFESQTKIINIKPDSQWVDISLNRMRENLYLYVGTYGGNDLFVVDVDSLKKVDSLYFTPGNMNRLYITPDGSKLYVTQLYQPYVTYYLDTKSRTFFPTNLPNGSIYFNNNREGFLFSNEGIFILNTLTNQVEKIDTLSFVEFVAFDNASPTFYFANYEGKLYQYDYQQKKIIDTLALPISWNKAMTPDNREIYFITRNGLLGVINIQSGAVEYITNANPNGRIAITPDGQYVLVTDPGSNLFLYAPPSGLLIVVRTSDHSLDKYIDIKPIAGDNTSAAEIIITPSNNYAFVTNSNGGDVFIIDIRQLKAIKRLEFRPISTTIRSLALGGKPK